MPISEKTRKILWGRSGNRCAVCRRPLVVDATAADRESVVGDECHIISGKIEGPRYQSQLTEDQRDAPDNLILLCRVHHKMVDDQKETYTVEVLSKLKANHEAWVVTSLNEEKVVPPVRIRRVQANIPTHLVRLTSGQEVTSIIGDAMAHSFDHDSPKSEAEVDLIAHFLQDAKDWGEIWSEVEAGDRVRAAFRLGEALTELERAGYWVFGGREVQRIEGGLGSPLAFPVAILRVLRSTNPSVVEVRTPGSAETADSFETAAKRSHSPNDT